MITVKNENTKKYFVCSDKERIFLPPGGVCALDGEIKIFRTYSRIYPLHIVLSVLLFSLCVVIVFLGTDYQNDDLWLVSVRYNCKAKSDSLKLTVQRSQLMNITKTGDLQANFTINKRYLFAHVISVFLYALLAIALCVFLGIFTRGEVLSPIFFALCGVATAGGGYMGFYTIKKFRSTLCELKEHYKDYSY